MANMFKEFRDSARRMQEEAKDSSGEGGGFFNRSAFGSGRLTWGLVFLYAFAAYALFMFIKSVLYFF